MDNGKIMKVNNMNWTWYMMASAPRPVVDHRPVPVKKIENKKVEKSLEAYDREGRQHKKPKSTFTIKA